MARVIKSNPLTTVKGAVSNLYAEFLRGKITLCAKPTVKIYRDLGNRIIIPQLIELTNDDLAKVTKDDLLTMIEDYSINHNEGGRDFLWRHLKAFINWYWNEYNPSGDNPADKVKLRKHSTKPITGITSEEVNLLLKTAKEHSVFPERDIAMIMILSDTGIRRRSLMELRMADVNVKTCELVTHEKDQQYHIHAFGSACAKAIIKYLSCLEDISPTDPFWLTMEGVALTTYGAKEVLRRLCTEAGIQVHHFHDFRRFFALELYNSTHDIYMVSRALDHKDVAVTKRYLAIDDRDNADAVRSYSPMDRRLRQTGVKVSRV